MNWSARGLDRTVETLRGARPAVQELINRGERVGDITAKALSASRDAALNAAERVTRREGADDVANTLHSARGAAGVLEPSELPITEYDQLNVTETVAAVRELADAAEVRAIIANEEVHKNRQRIVSAAQTRVAAIAQEIVGISSATWFRVIDRLKTRPVRRRLGPREHRSDVTPGTSDTDSVTMP